MKYKLAIFDFDGTLFDSITDVMICFNEVLASHGFPTLTREEFIICLGGNIDEIVSLILGENATPENISLIKEEYGKLYSTSDKKHTLPFEGCLDVLRQLMDENVLLAINSNRTTSSIRFFVEKFFSEIDFLSIEGHNPPYPSKPNPYGVEKILKIVNVAPEDAVYIGDSIKDIQTAQNAGIDCVIVSWGYGEKSDYENPYPIKIIDEVSKILEI